MTAPELELNQRIAMNMVAEIDRYRVGRSTLRRLLDNLEGGMHAMDPGFTTEQAGRFYELLGPLDLAVATDEESEMADEINAALDALCSDLAGLVLGDVRLAGS